MPSTRPGVIVGLRPSISDATPDTSGAEKLVPMPSEYAGSPGVVSPRLECDTVASSIVSPAGAARSTREPKFE